MGVYIDMEMPKKTYAHCMLIKDIDGSVQLHVCTKNSEEISEWEFYDLVPVPEPHGRLIDADAVILEDGPYEYDEWCEWALRQYQAAPTIIEAESGDVQRDYERAVEDQRYCEMYEPTYDPETGAM